MAIKRITDLTVKKNAALDEMRKIVEQVIAENRSKWKKRSK